MVRMQEPSHDPAGREAGGTRLGRYELAAELGRGAMGVVFRARDPIIDRVVALKTIESGRTGAAAATFTERFFQEARSAGRLNHPNIVTIYDAGEAEGQAYIAMEFLEGTSLREMLDEHGALSVHRAVEIATQVARGLGYAHEHGVVHRDIKPANIIVLRNRRPKITDFGIARLGEADVLAGERAGSPKYMSPEQIRGDEELDGRSDIFSLGAVLYEMLTGRQPFNGDDVLGIMRSVLEDSPERPSLRNLRVPPELDTIVLRMLAKRPEDRFPSARWLFRELRNLEEKLEKDAPVETRKAERAAPRVSADDPTLILGSARAAPAPERARWAPYAGAMAAVLVGLAVAFFALREAATPGEASRQAESPPPALPAPVLVAETPSPQPPPAPAPAADKPPGPAPSPKPVRVAKKKPAPAPAPIAAPAPALEPFVVLAPAPEPPPPPRPAVRETAKLTLAVSPWGEVYIDGRLRGTTPPLAEIELPPGRHRLEIRNSAQLPYLTVLEVQAGDSRQIQHRFAN
jgi:serine/threonine-protein kinase